MSGTNPVATWTLPDFTAQGPSEYKGNIDGDAAVAQRIVDRFAPRQSNTPAMTVTLDAGHVLNGNTLTEVAAQTTGTITAPVGNPRIDRVVIDNVTGAVSVITGTPAGSPTAPAITAGKTPIAQVLLQTTSTSITNDMITDERSFAALGDPLLVQPACYSMDNFTLTASVASNALTIALKDRNGSDPSATSPVVLSFRNSTAGTGDFTQLKATAATSVVVSSGSTLGTSNSVPFRVWVVAFNDAGTLRLGVINCFGTNGIVPLCEYQLKSSTAEGGAGAADSAGVFYTGTAVTTKAFRILGYVEYDSGLSTAGTWASAPTQVQLFTPGMKKPGEVVQAAYTQTGTRATGTTAIPFDNTIPQNTEGDQYQTLDITPTSKINRLLVEHNGMYGTSVAQELTAALFQDSTANALASSVSVQDGTNFMRQILLRHEMQAATVSSTTFKIRAGGNAAGTTEFNGANGGSIHGGVLASSLRIEERMV